MNSHHTTQGQRKESDIDFIIGFLALFVAFLALWITVKQRDYMHHYIHEVVEGEVRYRLDNEAEIVPAIETNRPPWEVGVLRAGGEQGKEVRNVERN